MDDRTERGFASSPCYAHEFESAELVARLNDLIEGQRAVVQLLDELLAQPLDEALRTHLQGIRSAHVESIEHCVGFLQ